MNRIAAVFIASLLVSVAVVSGGTYAFFTDAETSAGNTFTAGCWNDGGCDCGNDGCNCDCDRDCNCDKGGCDSECKEDENCPCECDEEGQDDYNCGTQGDKDNPCKNLSDGDIEKEANKTNVSPVSISFSSNGAELCGTVDVITSINNNQATHRNVRCVAFYVDGEEIEKLERNENSTYVYSWDTTKTHGGRHTLMVEAHYTAGTEVSEEIEVLVNNSMVDDSSDND